MSLSALRFLGTSEAMSLAGSIATSLRDSVPRAILPGAFSPTFNNLVSLIVLAILLDGWSSLIFGFITVAVRLMMILPGSARTIAWGMSNFLAAPKLTKPTF